MWDISVVLLRTFHLMKWVDHSVKGFTETTREVLRWSLTKAMFLTFSLKTNGTGFQSLNHAKHFEVTIIIKALTITAILGLTRNTPIITSTRSVRYPLAERVKTYHIHPNIWIVASLTHAHRKLNYGFCHSELVGCSIPAQFLHLRKRESTQCCTSPISAFRICHVGSLKIIFQSIWVYHKFIISAQAQFCCICIIIICTSIEFCHLMEIIW